MRIWSKPRNPDLSRLDTWKLFIITLHISSLLNSKFFNWMESLTDDRSQEGSILWLNCWRKHYLLKFIWSLSINWANSPLLASHPFQTRAKLPHGLTLIHLLRYSVTLFLLLKARPKVITRRNKDIKQKQFVSCF